MTTASEFIVGTHQSIGKIRAAGVQDGFEAISTGTESRKTASFICVSDTYGIAHIIFTTNKNIGDGSVAQAALSVKDGG